MDVGTQLGGVNVHPNLHDERVTKPVVVPSRDLQILLWTSAMGAVVGSCGASGLGPDLDAVDYIGTSALGPAGGIAFLRATRCCVELSLLPRHEQRDRDH